MKTLIASLALVLGAAPAFAQPGFDRHAEHGWVILSRASFGTDGRADIEPGTRGRFHQIQLATAGRLTVTEVAIEFADGSNQVEKDLHTRIDSAHPLTLDLAGGARELRRVIVYGPQGRIGSSVTLRGLE
ncbi:MAG TPA: hypothetical protein VGM88_20135 [Kofleriaceae bacterium]|jgi:hypothetical protein